MARWLATFVLAFATWGFSTGTQATSIPVDGTWQQVDWVNLGSVTQNPLTFTCAVGGCSAVLVDAFICGDQFSVSDQGVLLGSSSTTPGCTNQSIGQNPDAALLSASVFSRMEFTLGAGAHSLNITTIALAVTPGNTTTGSAYIKVCQPLCTPLSPAPVPTVGIPALIFSGLGIFGVAGYLSRRRKQL